MYALGNAQRIVGDADNPHLGKSTLEGAAVIDKNGWRIWVDHHITGERVYENGRERAHRADQAAT
ncbi:hypothetical protein [Paraburkholderia sp. SIMBA_054]|uniref:hypothetical protein n=1 Tax=Paraburkholderia sp. SIMBA_054 TaxID=3085795 RepID=UPI00397C4071